MTHAFLNQAYDRNEFVNFVQNFLPDFAFEESSISIGNNSHFEAAQTLGHALDGEVTVLEITAGQTNAGKRIAITKEAFSILRDHGMSNALIAFDNGQGEWRLSLLTTTLKLNDKGRVISEGSNPRRYSYLLGPVAKTNTPNHYLVKKGAVKDIADLQSRFSVEVVNKDFYGQIAKLYDKLVGTDKVKAALTYPKAGEASQEFAVRLIGRIVFCWFLREKHSSANVPLISSQLISASAAKSDNYYHKILAPLFFEVLNKRKERRSPKFRQGEFGMVPYLNGGLFAPQKGTDGDHYAFDKSLEMSVPGLVGVPDEWIRELFELLELYHFTVDENTSVDVDLSIDPEMLGRIFENLLARINPETGETVRKTTGSFYTPREIVEYMVDESLIQYLESTTGISNSKLKALVSYDLDDDLQATLAENDKSKIVEALAQVKILDPACGSGAFPMGALQKIVFILQQVDPDTKLWLDSQLSTASPELKKELARQSFDYLRKSEVIRKSIFGVDIQPIATEIARLRCFLTLIVDEIVDDSLNNRGVKVLPNLDFKFVTANSLISMPKEMLNAQEQQLDMFDSAEKIKRLQNLRTEYFTAEDSEKPTIREEFMSTQQEMLLGMIGQGAAGQLSIALTAWKPFGHGSTPWFDPEWMFGLNKFDIVIGNPPYDVLEKIKDADLLAYARSNPAPFKYALGGKLNIYRLFIERGHQILSEGGTLTYIVPSTLIADKSLSGIRHLFKEKLQLKLLIEFPEASKVFESVTQATTIFSGINHSGDSSFRLAVGLKSRELPPTVHADIDWESIYECFGTDLTLPLIKSQTEFNLIKKIRALSNELKVFAKCYKGDINLGTSKKALSLTDTGTLLLRGDNIHQYKLDLSFATGEKTERWFDLNIERVNVKDYARIVCQNVANMGLEKRIVAAEVPPNIVVGDSANCIEVFDASLDKYILGLLNSKLINWFFKITSTNNHVNIYELDSLPIPTKNDNESIARITELVKSRGKETITTNETDNQIDQLVYQVYNLTPNEIAIIEESAK